MSGLNEFLMQGVEMPLVPVVADMEDAGYGINVEFFVQLRARLNPELAELRESLCSLASLHGLPNFNPASSLQVNKLLYGNLGLPLIARTPTGQPSTEEKVLERFRNEHPIVAELLRHRKLSKIVSTYCSLPEKLGTDGRFHPEFNQLEAETGRFASKSIIQTLPKDDEFAIRNGFCASPGFMIVKADFKQQELRVLAQVSQDANMREAIANNIDLHGLAAAKVFHLNCEANEVETKYPRERQQIKEIQFGLLYGSGAHSLAPKLGLTIQEAEKLIRDYFKQFPTVSGFIEDVYRRVVRDGYVDDHFGRRRYLPNARLKLPPCKPGAPLTSEKKVLLGKVRAAKREAQNFVIQGAAATITKLAMIKCHRHVTEKFPDKARMILMLHDELQFEVAEWLVDEFAGTLPRLMCDLGLERFGFTVPMAVDIGVGPSWGETKKWQRSQDASTAHTG